MRKRLLFGAVALALAANLWVGARAYQEAVQDSSRDRAYPNLELFSQVVEIVRKDYVDGTNLTYRGLIYGALKGLVDSLDDPHSEFLEADRFKELQDGTQGMFGGLGLVVTTRDGALTVVAPL